MKLMGRQHAFTAAIVIPAAIVVVILAALQYRWSNQVSEATGIRLADSLQMSMMNWHLDFFRDFSDICVAMQTESGTGPQNNWIQYGRRFAEWRKTTTHPDLVSNVYILKLDEFSNPHALRLVPSSGRFESASWPSDLEDLRQDLQQASSNPASMGEASVGSGELRPPSTHSSNREFAERFYSGGALSGWQFESNLPALVHRLPHGVDRRTNNLTSDWLVIALNGEYVSNHLLPDLAQRYFRGTEGLDYQVAVISGGAPDNVMYSSDGGFGTKRVADADGTMDIFGRIQNKALGSPIHIFHTPSQNKGPATAVGISWFPLLGDVADDQDWQLIVRHRRGGALGAFVRDSRRRDLAISFGVLFLLVISMAILIVTTTRAQHLARLQMDFVTAVSHELRTPLTVISSAADNIAHGVVEGKQQLEQYGSVIGGQARKLFEMVEQILLFAAIREGQQRYSLRPLKVAEVIDAALSNTAGLIKTAGFSVDVDAQPDLPVVIGDFSALSQCLQNLITNALKYGSDAHWMGIRVRFTEHGLHGREIQIGISDRGIGIDASDLPHIFEPFYRSPSVTAAQIHGTGLGLPLARSIAEAMKGDLTVKSEPGRGSTFTVHLPCAAHPIRESGSEVRAVASS